VVGMVHDMSVMASTALSASLFPLRMIHLERRKAENILINLSFLSFFFLFVPHLNTFLRF
jgi:hypothetical protein